MPILYIVATPIGNLEDLSLRALRILKEVDLVLCEDTRLTRKLLNRYTINAKTLSYHQHSNLKKINDIIQFLRQGRDIALVSDAGTPGISDPGNKLVYQIVKELGNKVEIVPIPGPSAVIAAASISGFPMDKFVFLGFPPAKKKRNKFFEEALKSKYPVIFYESPYRILKTLNELKLQATSYKLEPKIVVCRELTKKFETIYRGEIKEVIKEIEGGVAKGEFVVIVKIR